MKVLLDRGNFTDAELEVIKNPEMLNDHLEKTAVSENKDFKEMYAFAKERFYGVIPIHVIKNVTDPKFRNDKKIRAESRTKKISRLRKAISSTRKKLVIQKHELDTLMKEPFSLLTSEDES